MVVIICKLLRRLTGSSLTVQYTNFQDIDEVDAAILRDYPDWEIVHTEFYNLSCLPNHCGGESC